MANDTLRDALRHLEGFNSGQHGWTNLGSNGDVKLISQNVTGANLPMFLGQLTASSACSVADLTAVILSDACRRFWDPSYLASHVLCTCGDSRSAVLCTEQKGSPISAEALWTNVCTARHVRKEQGERITYAATSVPADFRKQHRETLSTWGVDKKELITKIWAMDVLRTNDQVQLSFLLLSEASSFHLPNFMLKQVLASWLGVCVNSVWRMSTSGMTPKGSICLAPVTDEDTETIMLGSRQLTVSGPVIIQLASDNGSG
ncbi:psuG [Symbiodinium sp. CCMP2456]|nr:psuG [Symbiodinium sp. CCMP2456]